MEEAMGAGAGEEMEHHPLHHLHHPNDSLPYGYSHYSDETTMGVAIYLLVSGLSSCRDAVGLG